MDGTPATVPLSRRRWPGARRLLIAVLLVALWVRLGTPVELAPVLVAPLLAWS